MTVKEAERLWNISKRRITELCRTGKIYGAQKVGRDWMIPENTEKPVDGRIKTGKERAVEAIPRLPLPIGVSVYREAVEGYYYIDKTMMIKDFLDERPKVSLFHRKLPVSLKIV